MAGEDAAVSLVLADCFTPVVEPPYQQLEAPGADEEPNTWLDVPLDKWFADSPDILHRVDVPLEDLHAYAWEPSEFVPTPVMSWYVADQGLIIPLPEPFNPGQDDFLPPHADFIPLPDKWFVDSPQMSILPEPEVSESWTYPWEPSLYTVPVFDWFFQDPVLQLPIEPIVTEHLDVPEWLVRTLPLGAPTWQQETPFMPPPVQTLPEIEMVIPLLSLDDVTLPDTDTAVHGKAEESSGTYQRS